MSSKYPGYFLGSRGSFIIPRVFPGYNLWANIEGLRPSFRFILFANLSFKARQSSQDLQVIDSSPYLHPFLALKAEDWARMRQIKVFKAVSPRARLSPSFARVAKPLVFPGLRLINSIILSRGISVHDTSYCYPRHAYLIMDHSHPLSSTQSIHL